MSPLDIGPSRSPEERVAFAQILWQALSFPRLDTHNWLERYDDVELVLARADGAVAAGTAMLDVGQYFGGKRVRMGAVHGVGVKAEARGKGMGGALMRHAIRTLADRNVPLSCLYPATQPVYRAAGYEQAGTYTQYSIPVASIDARDRSLEIRPVGFDDWAKLAVGYQERARFCPGHVDRDPWFWRRILDRPTMELFAYSVGDADDPDGHIALIRDAAADDYRHDLICNELVWRTPEALRRLLTLVADHRSMARNWLVSGPPHTPGLPLITEQCWKVTEQVLWMLRVVDVEAALTARGYSSAVSGAVVVELQDPLVPANCDRFKLTVEAGVAAVERGGSGPTLRMDIGALAPLYSGHRSAEALCAAGLVTGDTSAAAIASSIFAGAPPWIPAIF